ncbi:GmrSD restriction endonuclease domain-containing protein [Lacinutrix sp. MEBiC02595]
MSNWKPYTVEDILEKIDNEEFVLPVVQRNLVWKEEKIELLFDTLLKGDSFGGIMTIKDFKNRKPLFAFRPFIKKFYNSQKVESKNLETLPQNLSYVVDGQQRLSAFNIGILGEYNNRKLYFDLLSEVRKDNFNFSFAKDTSELKKELDNFDGTSKNSTLWISVTDLFKQIKEAGKKYKYVAEDEIFNIRDFTKIEKERILDCLESFTDEIFSSENIGICEVRINLKDDITKNRQRVVELFRRLNQGGTKLDGLELMASKLKGFNSANEKFLFDIRDFDDIGFGQDEVIKLLFILQDNHKKNIADISETDSNFITENEIRIKNSLIGTRGFLKNSNLYEFYNKNKPSIIPLYFIAYHLYHLDVNDDKLNTYFDTFDTSNQDFKLIENWLKLSMLNKVFRRRGAGWTAYSTGIRKILEVCSKNKNQLFPKDALYEMYYNHGLDFSDEIKEEWLHSYDFDFLMYLIYDRPKTFRINDIDHIHPKSILESNEVEWNKINNVANFQLLDMGTNRGEKNGKEFEEWTRNYVKNITDYTKIHLIPENKILWKSNNFERFLEKRQNLMVEKLNILLK